MIIVGLPHHSPEVDQNHRCIIFHNGILDSGGHSLYLMGKNALLKRNHTNQSYRANFIIFFARIIFGGSELFLVVYKILLQGLRVAVERLPHFVYSVWLLRRPNNIVEPLWFFGNQQWCFSTAIYSLCRGKRMNFLCMPWQSSRGFFWKSLLSKPKSGHYLVSHIHCLWVFSMYSTIPASCELRFLCFKTRILSRKGWTNYKCVSEEVIYNSDYLALYIHLKLAEIIFCCSWMDIFCQKGSWLAKENILSLFLSKYNYTNKLLPFCSNPKKHARTKFKHFLFASIDFSPWLKTSVLTASLLYYYHPKCGWWVKWSLCSVLHQGMNSYYYPALLCSIWKRVSRLHTLHSATTIYYLCLA